MAAKDKLWYEYHDPRDETKEPKSFTMFVMNEQFRIEKYKHEDGKMYHAQYFNREEGDTEEISTDDLDEAKMFLEKRAIELLEKELEKLNKLGTYKKLSEKG